MRDTSPGLAPSLDATDLKILRMLQHDGRASAQTIAERVHLSPRATLARIRAMEKSGWIQGYSVSVNALALGGHVTVFAEVIMRDQRKEIAQAFERRMRETPKVVACHLLSGRYDYLVRVCCRNLEEYQLLSNAWLDDVSLGIERIVTSTQLEVVKEYSGLPL